MSVNRKILTWLETELFEGRLELGQNLPDDRKLANIIHASHSSTREALKQLEIMGILRLYEGKRKTIIARLVSEPFVSAAPALRLHMSSSRHPMRDIVQTRILLESWAVRHAIPSSPVLEELESILTSMQREGILPQEFHQYEVDFHIALTKLSGNQLLAGLMTSMREPIYEYLLSIMGKVPLWSATAIRLRAEHQAILAALQAGDGEMASQLVISTIERQYSEAGIDLDEATEVVNDLPGTRASIAPVEVEQDDLIPQDWEVPVASSLIEALENIGAPAHTSDRQAPEHRFSPVDSAPRDAENEESEDTETAQDSESSKTSESAELIPHQRSTTSSNFTAVTGKKSSAGSSRRRRGVVSSAVHATVIKPINRSQPAVYTPSEPESVETRELAEQERLQRIAQLSDEENIAVSSPEEPQTEAAAAQEMEPAEPALEAKTPTPKKPRRLRGWLGLGKNSNASTSAQEKENSQEENTSEELNTPVEEEPPAGLSTDVPPEDSTEETVSEDFSAEREDFQEPVQSQAPEGYVFANEYHLTPEIIDETPREPRTKKVKEQASLSDSSTINKKSQKKKKRKR